MIDNEKLQSIFSNVLNIPLENVSENSSMENTKEWDSLAHLNLLLTIEEEFNIKFPMEKIQEVNNFTKIKEELEKLQ